MEEAGQLDALERAVEGTLAEGSFEFDDEESVLRIEGSLILTTGWFLGFGAGGVSLLLTGAVLSLTGLQDQARWALAPGAVLLALVAGFVLLLRFTPLAGLWSDLELRFAEQAMVHRRTRIPFGDLRPEHLVWKNGRFFRRLYVRHPSLRKQLAGFFGSEERQAEEFQRRLWELISTPDLNGVLTHGSDLTPVQRWIIAAGAPMAPSTGSGWTGSAPRPARPPRPPTAAPHRTCSRIPGAPTTWSSCSAPSTGSSRTGTAPTSHRTRTSPAGPCRAAGVRVAAARGRRPHRRRPAGAPVRRAADRAGPRPVRGRGGSYARLVPPLLRDEPGADASEEGAELALFLHQLFNDRNHATEELHRLEALADPALRANVGRFLIWDYGRALMLYRWGHIVGWLTEEYCWDRMLPLALDIQRRYASWRDMATCYLQGRLLWSGGGGKAQAEYEQLIEELATEPRSPWNLVPWDLDLTRDWA